MPVDTLLKLTDVSKSFASAEGGPVLSILRNVSLTMNAGDSVAFVGPSGSGKSTLLHLIGGLDKPDSGDVLLNGQNLAKLPEKDLAKIRNKQIGFVFQAHHLLPQCTVLENVLVPTLALKRSASEEQVERARKLLDRVGLSDRLSHRPAQLSGGERQRVAVVRALINAPKLLLADEPTGSLDQNSAVTLADLLVQLNEQENTALIVVTHSLDIARRMKVVYELKEGSLVKR